MRVTLAKGVEPVQGWGLLNQFLPFRYFLKFSTLSKHTLCIEYHVYIWQMSPQPSWGDTCQIWMWFKEPNGYFCEIENFAYGEINERSFSNPHPSTTLLPEILLGGQSEPKKPISFSSHIFEEVLFNRLSGKYQPCNPCPDMLSQNRLTADSNYGSKIYNDWFRPSN